MPFKHIIDEKKKIVVIKAKGKVSTMDILSEIQNAVNTSRGEGLERRLIDMRDQGFTFDLETAQKIIKMLKASANVLGSKKVAVLFKEIPEDFEFDKLKRHLHSENLQIGIFTDKAQAARFLSQRVAKK